MANQQPRQRTTGRGAHPYSLKGIITNPLARMLPLAREQTQVYRLGDSHPPSGILDGHGPTWEAISFVMAAQTTLQARVNVQRDFTLLAIAVSTTSNVNGGFRASLYDTIKQRRLSDRAVQQALMGGDLIVSPTGAFFLREPYEFDAPDSQILVSVQNLEAVTNTIQIALYGLALRFNEPGAQMFPGGNIPNLSSAGGAK